MHIFSQRILGSDLSLTGSALTGLTGFGSSLASGVDVDDNTYNGTYCSLKCQTDNKIVCSHGDRNFHQWLLIHTELGATLNGTMS